MSSMRATTESRNRSGTKLFVEQIIQLWTQTQIIWTQGKHVPPFQGVFSFLSVLFTEHLESRGDAYSNYCLTFTQLHKYVYPARALRALGLLLADGALTVGWGKTFWGIGRVPSRKRA